MTATEPEVRWTETTVLDAIEPRYRKAGNGGSGEYAFMRQVRNDAGFDASRTFDAVAVHLWPSRGFVVEVIEVKVSRADWLRELKNPAKAEAAHAVGDRFIVAAPAGIVHPDELPPGWGLLEVTAKRVRMTVPPKTHTKGKRTTFRAGFTVAMLRAAGATALRTPDDVAVQQRVDALRAQLEAQHAERLEVAERQCIARAEAALAFVSASRVYLHGDVDHARREGLRVAAALRADADRGHLVTVLRNQRDRLDRMLADLELPTE